MFFFCDYSFQSTKLISHIDNINAKRHSLLFYVFQPISHQREPSRSIFPTAKLLNLFQLAKNPFVHFTSTIPTYTVRDTVRLMFRCFLLHLFSSAESVGLFAVLAFSAIAYRWNRFTPSASSPRSGSSNSATPSSLSTLATSSHTPTAGSTA